MVPYICFCIRGKSVDSGTKNTIMLIPGPEIAGMFLEISKNGITTFSPFILYKKEDEK